MTVYSPLRRGDLVGSSEEGESFAEPIWEMIRTQSTRTRHLFESGIGCWKAGNKKDALSAFEDCVASMTSEGSGLAHHLGMFITSFVDPREGLSFLDRHCISRGFIVADNDYHYCSMIESGKLDLYLYSLEFVARQGILDLRNNLEAVEQQKKNIASGFGPALLSTMPKSGSMYLSQILRSVYHTDWFGIGVDRLKDGGIQTYLSKEKVKIFGKGGIFCQQHLAPTKENLDALARNGIERVFVTIRDPRQTTLSWVCWIKTFHSGMHGFRSIDLVPPDYYDLDWNGQLEWHLKNYLPTWVKWIQDWIDISENDPRFDVMLSEFRELKENSVDVLGKIIEFFDIPFQITGAPHPKEVPFSHYRAAALDEWRGVFSDRQKKMAAISGDLCRRFDWHS